MRGLIKKGKKNIDVRMKTLDVVKNVRPKDWWGEINAIHEYVRDNIRYVKDIRGVETIHTPERILDVKQGDCDDKVILAASMLESIGHPTRLVAMGFGGGGYSHVLVETKIGNKWIPLETTMDWEAGRAPKNVTSRMTIKV